ncbi:MAG: leucyl aminopeptidase, partial [Caulobacter sp.]|nr:leucyl aminopeptidase [Caulobacter sp.]
MRIEFVQVDRANPPTEGATATAIIDGGKLSEGAQDLDKATSGALARAVAAGRFKGAKGANLELIAPAGRESARITLLGVGDGQWNSESAETFGASAYAATKTNGASTLTLLLPGASGEEGARAAFGATLASYRFDKYRTTEKADKKPSIETIKVAVDDPAAAAGAWVELKTLADAIFFSRDLVSEPPNVLYPESYAQRVKALESMGLEVEILGEAEMAKLGMGSLLGVGQGSIRDSQLVVIQWKGGGDAQPIAFVGKGVTFDTGGISIKPADGMEDMKWDMGGSAAVAGLMHAIAGRKAKANVVGILGLVENMPDGNAQRPGDVVTSMSGQTIEIINTDAEGRLVLADVIHYTAQRFKPKFMIDLATLTGAIIVALGQEYAGMFVNNDELSHRLHKAGEATGELVWRM